VTMNVFHNEKAFLDSCVLVTQLGTAGTHIWSIEDDPHMQKIWQRIFSEQGYSVICLRYGQAGRKHSAI